MKEHTILVTGEYWHPDFQPFISTLDIPVTMVPIEKIESVKDYKFDLVLVAQSRRNQISDEDIESLQALFINLPVVALLGSWCEGEPRSGAPWPGVTRVYWHQWEGRYDRFVEQLDHEGITDWHAPRTSSVADQIAGLKKAAVNSASGSRMEYIGVSAWTRDQYEMIADSVKHFGWRCGWVERALWDGATSRLVSAICVDADSWSGDLQNRLKWIHDEIPEAPMVLLLSYPRQDEMDAIRRAGVAEVVSKPFELADLESALKRAMKKDAMAKSPSEVSVDR